MKLSFILVFIISSQSALAGERDLRFNRACDRGTEITISAVGDLLLHGPLQRQAYSSQYGFRSIWSEAIPYFNQADISYANLEGPVADGVQCNGARTDRDDAVLGSDCRKSRSSVYTSYPRFNYHSMLVDDLKRSGIDFVSTANNHSLDRFTNGADATIQALEAGQLPFAGTRESNSGERPFYRVTRVQGKNIAWVSCTYGTNGIADKHNQVLNCFTGDQVTGLVSGLKNQVDAVIVTPHWGNEYHSTPNSRQKDYARRWLNAGATAIIGTHPHVVQPWEKFVTNDGRETLIVYSLGNFVSNQQSFNKKATILLFVGLTIGRNEAWVNGVRYAPAYMARTNSGGSLFVSSIFGSSVENDVVPYMNRFFGSERIVYPNERVVTNAECR